MDKKNLTIVAVGVVVVIGLVSVLLLSSKSSKTSQKTSGSNLPVTSEVVPTVDASVMVSVKYLNAAKHDLVLDIKGLPSGTETVEYQLSYNTKSRGVQGVFPDEPVDVKGKSEFSRQFFIGSESSGAKTYDVIDGPVTVSIKFNGNYGAKSFEKDFNL